MARNYGCYVYGIDLSVNMILTALERAAAAGNGDKVCCVRDGFWGLQKRDESKAGRREAESRRAGRRGVVHVLVHCAVQACRATPCLDKSACCDAALHTACMRMRVVNLVCVCV
jgi:hypothetical protein